jgi:hypothetical protein
VRDLPQAGRTSNPFMFGIMMSSRIKSTGSSVRRRSRAAAPSWKHVHGVRRVLELELDDAPDVRLVVDYEYLAAQLLAAIRCRGWGRGE